MKKVKICITIFLIYEIVAILLLGLDTRYWEFDYDDVSTIAWFWWCLFVPIIVTLICSWWKEIKVSLANGRLKIAEKEIDSRQKIQEEQFNKLFDELLYDFNNMQVIELVRHLCKLSVLSAQYKDITITKSFVKESIVMALNTIITTNEKPVWTAEAKKIIKAL